MWLSDVVVYSHDILATIVAGGTSSISVIVTALIVNSYVRLLLLCSICYTFLYYEIQSVGIKLPGQYYPVSSIYCDSVMWCLLQQCFTVYFYSVTKSITCNVWGGFWRSIRPQWPTTPKDIIHPRHWTFLLLVLYSMWGPLLHLNYLCVCTGICCKKISCNSTIITL